MRMMLVRCDEKVDRLCSMLCSSPMSAKMRPKIGKAEPSAAGMNSPDCAINASSPVVLSDTVLPPVLGPVISVMRVSLGM